MTVSRNQPAKRRVDFTERFRLGNTGAGVSEQAERWKLRRWRLWLWLLDYGLWWLAGLHRQRRRHIGFNGGGRNADIERSMLCTTWGLSVALVASPVTRISSRARLVAQRAEDEQAAAETRQRTARVCRCGF